MPNSVVVMGASLGGFDALKAVLGYLASGFSLPIVVVQHQSADSRGDLAGLLQRHTRLNVLETEDKEMVRPGHVYLAPSGYHLLLEEDSLALSTDAPVWYARPSIDVLFESAAETHGSATIGVVLTGASTDGALGLAKIRARGGLTIVQDPGTARSPVLPKAAIAAAMPHHVLPLEEIGALLNAVAAARAGAGHGRS